MNWFGGLSITNLLRLYRSKLLRPIEVIQSVYSQIEDSGDDHVWIHLIPKAEAMERALQVELKDLGAPLAGIPFAVKDLFDVQGIPTTSACPSFSYIATESAVVVRKLLEAGAILIGKTNMDQFATGLGGVRSPYGIPRNPFDHACIPGGSSSGSAVAVSTGLVSFALGSDTAGSGRVPAAFANIVGVKPSRGWLSTRGMLPACRTLDCVSIFALTCGDARIVMELLAGFDREDTWSRRKPELSPIGNLESPSTFRFGVPCDEDLRFFGNRETPHLFARSIHDLEELGGVPVEVDYAPFREASDLLYGGPWVAERMLPLKAFFEQNESAVHPVTRCILRDGSRFSAADAFEASYRLAEIKRITEPIWSTITMLAVPTAGTTYTIAEMEADPISLNTTLGYYTNFVNLLDCCAVATPHSFTSRGLPFGITLVAPAWQDAVILEIAERLQRLLGLRLGATQFLAPLGGSTGNWVPIVVAGAHLRGQPLNSQLRGLGGRFVRQTRTAPQYQFFALTGRPVPKPGLLRVAEGGASIEVEVWELPVENLGQLVRETTSPLAIGTVTLENGESLNGFICEPFALAEATNITSFRSWKAFQERNTIP